MPRSTFKQTFLKPGRYHLGGGLFRDVSAADVADYVRGTQALLGAGHSVPILFEHAAPGTAEGAPVQLSTATKSRRDKLAEQVRHGAGWLKGVSLAKDGSAVHELDVADETARKGIKAGTIKFTSPELRETWTDGKGREFKRIISHVALTHKPRNPDQSAIEEVVSGAPAPAVQFSLADWAPLQLSDVSPEDDDIDGDNPSPKEGDDEIPEENKDAPVQEETDPQFSALLQQLKELGLDLTSDTTPETFQRDLLTACKTRAATLAQIEQDKQADDDDENDDDKPDGSDVHEEKPPVQFSLSDVDDVDATTGNPIVPKLLGLVMRGRHESLIATARAAQAEGQFPPALTQRITDLAGSMQFSAEAEEAAQFSIGEMVGVLRETLPTGAYTHWTSDQFSNATVDVPPAPLTAPPESMEMTPEQARAYVDQQAKHIPGLAAKK